MKMFPSTGPEEHFDVKGFSEFYTKQIDQIDHVMNLTLEEKNEMLLNHDADYFDPESKNQEDHWMNKIRGELIIKIDSF